MFEKADGAAWRELCRTEELTFCVFACKYLKVLSSNSEVSSVVQVRVKECLGRYLAGTTTHYCLARSKAPPPYFLSPSHL